MTGSNRAQHAEDVTCLREPGCLEVVDPRVSHFCQRLAPVVYANLGNVCNLRCTYCSVDYRSAWRSSPDETRRLLERAARGGLRKVNLVGGEPTVEPELPGLLATARDLGFVAIGVTTNGQRLADADYADDLLAHGLTSVQLSLNAVDPALVGALADTPLAGENALLAVRTLLGRPSLDLVLACVVTRLTLGHLDAYVEAVEQWSMRRGAPIPILFTQVVPQGRAATGYAQVVPRPADAARALVPALDRANRAGLTACTLNVPPCLLPGREALSLDAYLTNVRLRLETGERVESQRDIARQKRHECGRCRWVSFCPGVHANDVAAFGWDDYRPVPTAGGVASGAAPEAAPHATARSRPAGTAVVVGGTGFLGRHVVAALIGAGWRVTTLSRSGTRGAETDPGVTHVRGDRSDSAVIGALLRDAPDLWVDLAIFDGASAKALVNAWRPGSPTLFVVAGSIAEYGDLHRLPRPIAENAPLGATDRYGVGKVEAWRVLDQAASGLGMPMIWAVLPQVWGPGDRHFRDGALVHDLVCGRPLVLVGDGRDILPDGYVGTIAEGLLHVAGSPALVGARVHVAGPDDVTPLDYVEIAARSLRLEAMVLLVPRPQLRRVASALGVRFRPAFGGGAVALQRRRLAAAEFQPSVSARDGIAITVAAHARRDPPASALVDLPSGWIEALRSASGVTCLRVG